MHRVHAWLAVICHLHFWQNDWDLLRATDETRGGTDTEVRQKVYPGEDSSPTGTRIRNLLTTSPALWPLSYLRSPSWPVGTLRTLTPLILVY